MDLHEQRMQCLKMAFELGGKPESILSAAQQLIDFVNGNSRPEIAAVAVPEIVQPTIAEPETASEPLPDPIAACGTALVMPESGELADAVPMVDTSAIAAEPQAPAVEAAPADANLTPPEDAASSPEASAPAMEPEAAATETAADDAEAEEVRVEEAIAGVDAEPVEATPATPADVSESGESAVSIN
jgi:hypothetical protein